MKKIIIILLFSAFVISSYGQSNNTFYRHKISINCGSSIMGIVTNNFIKGSLVNDTYASPMPQISYIFSPDKNFGFGPAISYQLFKLDFLPINQQSSGVLMKINRLNFSFQAMYYFVNNESLTIYPGIRLGLTSWTGNVSFKQLNDYLQSVNSIPMIDEVLEKLTLSDVRFSKIFLSYQMFLGADIYVSKNIGLKLEFAIGSPYWALAGANFRF